MSEIPAVPILEGFPDHIQAKLELREYRRRRAAAAAPRPFALELVFRPLQLWRSGLVTVSFKGGDMDLHRDIATVAATWSQYGALEFDFGFDKDTGRYRAWTATDTSKIRVGFEHEGYWSLVGTDSTDPQIAPPGVITLNLDGFDRARPAGWAGTVLHEFGHALGFQHEHQSPAARCDFDWEALYEYLAGPPNNWPRSKVDRNLRPVLDNGIEASGHDPDSIMHYALPSWMFANGAQSPCYTDRNNDLSDTDKAMMTRAYPHDERSIEVFNNARVAVAELAAAAGSLHAADRDWVDRHIAFLRG